MSICYNDENLKCIKISLSGKKSDNAKLSYTRTYRRLLGIKERLFLMFCGLHPENTGRKSEQKSRNAK